MRPRYGCTRRRALPLAPSFSFSLSLELRGECDFAALILGECAAAYIKNASARREMSFFSTVSLRRLIVRPMKRCEVNI